MAFILKCILSDMSIATPAFLFFPFAWNIFTTPHFQFMRRLHWVSCRQNIVFFFIIQSATLCLLIGTFSALTFQVISGKYAFIATLFSCWFYVSPLFLSFFFFFFVFFVFCLFQLDDFLSFYACVLFFLVYVNVLFGFDLWLPCFSNMLTLLSAYFSLIVA